jgi:hypothetical protein
MNANEQHSQDRTSRFALDTLLRDAGYVLIERKHNRPPLWKHRMSSDVITEEQALAKLPRNKVIMAKKRQREYWENFRMTKVPLASEGVALCSGLQ